VLRILALALLLAVPARAQGPRIEPSPFTPLDTVGRVEPWSAPPRESSRRPWYVYPLAGTAIGTAAGFVFGLVAFPLEEGGEYTYPPTLLTVPVGAVVGLVAGVIANGSR
jgi:hypothetical protein